MPNEDESSSVTTDSNDFSGLETGEHLQFTLAEPGTTIYSDFNHTGKIEHSDERSHRHERTGCILLPLLPERDGPQSDSDASDSEAEEPQADGSPDRLQISDPALMTAVEVRSPEQGTLRDDERAVLQFDHPEEQRRVRGYRETPDSPDHLAPVLGDEAGEADLPSPLGPDGTRFQLHATTLAGDPRAPGPMNQPPPTHPPEDRTPGEVWVRLRHRQGGADQPEKDDLALFQIAPLLLPSNLAPARRLYVVAKETNHNFVYDVMEACWNAFGADGKFKRDFAAPFPASTPEKCRTAANAGDVATVELDDDGDPEPLLTPNKMYLIDGSRYSSWRGNEGGFAQYPDVWIQDQMALGYCSAPGDRAISIALHCKRASSLGTFVEQEMPDMDDDLSVFNGLSERASGAMQDATDYGGNIAVSPPVDSETTAVPTKKAGPPVKAHPPAPHGKIILGDCHNGRRPRNGVVHEATRDFLQSQESQPIVPIDTSWLSVGHVDEIMTFVPSEDGPKLAMARPDIMDTILKATAQIAVEDGRTHVHRGRYTGHFNQIKNIIQGAFEEENFAPSYDEMDIETFYHDHIRANNKTRTRFLRPIERRLCHCTGLDRPDDVLPLPVFFRCTNQGKGKWGKKCAEACTPNVVNMQVLNTNQGTHLLVPRPCGPRLPRDKAREAVETVRDTHNLEYTVQLPQAKKDGEKGFRFWAWPNLTADTLALFFTREKMEQGESVFLTSDDRKELIATISDRNRATPLSRTLRNAVDDTKEKILEKNGGAEALLEDGKFTDWHRLFIPEDTVDVVEAYTKSVLKEADCQVHFVDAWFYHTGGGNVHCGTNVLREPERADGTRPWWNTYPDLAAANTDYDPTETAHSTDTAQPTDTAQSSDTDQSTDTDH